jgi:hypothetical protein
MTATSQSENHIRHNLARRRVPLALTLAPLLTAFAVLVASTPAHAAAQGNSPAAKLCQKGGWQNYVNASGQSFTSEAACTSNGAMGGSYVPAAVVAPCLNEGWQTFARADGSAFSSENACRSYTAAGGVLTLRYPQARALCESYGGTFGAGGPDLVDVEGSVLWVCNGTVTPDLATAATQFEALAAICFSEDGGLAFSSSPTSNGMTNDTCSLG